MIDTSNNWMIDNVKKIDSHVYLVFFLTTLGKISYSKIEARKGHVADVVYVVNNNAFKNVNNCIFFLTQNRNGTFKLHFIKITKSYKINCTRKNEKINNRD